MLTIQGIEILRELHQSESNVVYLGRDTDTQATVAVKMLKDEFPSLYNIARFNEEYEITNKYPIEGIRRVIARKKVQNKHTLILEYVEGTTLRELIDRQKLSWTEFLPVAIRITRILEDIHRHHIVHKDINPKNIILLDDHRVKIIDFGIASLIRREVHQMSSPDVLEGTLAYISPEQTGRMNRSVDYRSDLYSLGVTFYEMLTGELPFDASDAMEVVHSHIARPATAPHLLNSEIPEALSGIVLKLLAKNAEDRYQGAAGLRADLEHCLNTWQQTGAIPPFQPGQHDVYDRFQIPEKLYGRNEERGLLLDAFERVSRGALELMLVAGASGIGKTALVNEVHKPITEKRGYFISGKFEQFQRDVPYGAILEAMNDFVSQLLSESPERIEQWREKMMEAVGVNGRVVVDMIPPLELIIGKQPAVPELPPAESQNRFNRVFQHFIRNISRAEHPIVMFIDDWQWADSASLGLLKVIMTDLSNQHLLVIGAYRDNEVSAVHPFMMTVEETRQAGSEVITLHLDPLSRPELAQLISDTLHTSPEKAEPLAALIHTKTAGTPFFVNQFLQSLYEEGHIQFNHTQRQWEWDTEQIGHLGITNNVVELMSGKIQKLSPQTQHVLQLAACIGNYFPLTLLARINGKHQKATLDELKEALEEGLVITAEGHSYAVDETTVDARVYFRFLHDRVEQAAYSLVSEAPRKQVHLQLGRILLEGSPEEKNEEHLFDIVNYLNSARELLSNPAEIRQLAEFNVKAGRKAKHATAYRSAAQYFAAARELIGNSWNTDYALTFEIYREQGECELLCGHFDLADELLGVALEKATSRSDRAQIYIIRLAQKSGVGQYMEAVATSIEALRLFGIEIPDPADSDACQAATGAEIGRYQQNMQDRSIADLFHLHLNRDQDIKLCLKIAGNTMDALVIGVPQLFALYAAKIVNLSIEHGLSPESPIGFSWFAVVLTAAFGNYKGAYEFTSVALKINEEKILNPAIRSKVYHLYGYYSVLKEHIDVSAEWQKRGYQAGLEVGDLGYACYDYAVYLRYVHPGALELRLEEVYKGIGFFKSVHNAPLLLLTRMYEGCIRSLMGRTNFPGSFDWEEFNEQQFLDVFTGTAPAMIALYNRFKLQVLVTFELFDKARGIVGEYRQWMPHVAGVDLFFASDCYLYTGVAAAALLETSEPQEAETLKATLLDCIEKLSLLAAENPVNFRYPLLILEGERARLDNKVGEAMDFYEEAILSAQENNFAAGEALASELAGKFYLQRKKPDIARVYLTKAHYAYKMWGADAKLATLEDRYPAFIVITKAGRTALTKESIARAAYTIHAYHHTETGHEMELDVQTLVKASQAISGEIKLDRLLTKMMRILIENAGAERGLIIQSQGTDWMIAAAGSAGDGNIEVMQKLPGHENDQFPVSLIRYVERTKENLVLNDALRDRRFGQDAYIQRHGTRSVLCSPIIHQGRSRAVIYLENNLAANAFSPERIQLLTMLSGQISISIENAVLYENLEQKVAERTAELHERNGELNQKNEELHEKNLRITDSLRYAKKIQQAILPSEKELAESFAQYMVIYKPKDIVSGDFYWFKKIENKVFIAAVDCTGHGVPGAFMSIIGNTLLDEIVQGKRIFDPAYILQILSHFVKTGLKQVENENNDGMDVCLCMLDRAPDGGTQVTFAGAGRPLYYLQRGELLSLPGDHYSVGGNARNQAFFNNQRVVLYPGDVLYLTSDGYAAQVNPQQEALGVDTLQRVLRDTAALPLSEQGRVLEKVLADFQQDEAQVDDITLLAVRL